MKPWVIPVRKDVFGIADRLREIDDGYRVGYNRRTCAFEVHHCRQRGDTFALTVPYPSLDCRTVALVRRTRAENARRLWEELEKENARAEEARRKRIADRAAQAWEEKQRGEKRT